MAFTQLIRDVYVTDEALIHIPIWMRSSNGSILYPRGRPSSSLHHERGRSGLARSREHRVNRASEFSPLTENPPRASSNPLILATLAPLSARDAQELMAFCWEGSVDCSIRWCVRRLVLFFICQSSLALISMRPHVLARTAFRSFSHGTAPPISSTCRIPVSARAGSKAPDLASLTMWLIGNEAHGFTATHLALADRHPYSHVGTCRVIERAVAASLVSPRIYPA